VTPVDRSKLPDVGADPVFAFPAIARHRLPNGLQVLTVEHSSVPVVTFVVQVRGGSGADPGHRAGLAAMVADMIDEGTGSLSAIDVSDALARIGADYDVEVGGDATVFSLATLARFASRGASLLADMVCRPSLRQDDFARVRQLRLDRLRQLKDVASALAEGAFLRLLYADHPYGHLAIGHDASLREMSLDEVAAFHRGSMVPSSTTVIACGALSHDELRRQVEDAFGPWSAAAGVASPHAPSDIEPGMMPSARLAVVPREGAAQSELRIGHLSTRRVTPDHPALVVMNAVLGGQFVSRINLKLREEKGYTYGARTSFEWRCGVSPFVVQTSVHTAATAAAIADCLGELTDIGHTRPPSEDELSLAKASLTRGYPRAFETAQQVARSVAQLDLYGLPDSYFSEFVPRINAVTREHVVDVARRHLDAARLTTLVVGDFSAIAESLRALGLGEPTVLPARI